jgi:hypothetical protein
MKRRLNRTFRILPLALIVATASTIGIGYAAWNFSQTADRSQSASHTITDWGLWAGKNLITDEVIGGLINSFGTALNDPSSTEGQNWTTAWGTDGSNAANYVESGWGLYIGSMVSDSDTVTALKNALDYDNNCGSVTYTIFIKYLKSNSDCCDNQAQHTSGGFDIFIYKGDFPAIGQTATGITRTCMQYDSTTKTYSAIYTCIGSSTVVGYTNGSSIKSINSGAFNITTYGE